MPSERITRHQQKRIDRALKEKARRQEGKPRYSPTTSSSRTPRAESRDWAVDDENFEMFASLRTRKSSPRTASYSRVRSEPAVVVSVFGSEAIVLHNGRELRARLPNGPRPEHGANLRGDLVAGDRVQLQLVSNEQARILDVQPRHSSLTRGAGDSTSREFGRRSQILAANIDQVIVVCSPATPPFRPRLIDRYLVAASRDGLSAVICLNKADLGVGDEIEEYLQGYVEIGVPVLRVSTVTGEGLPGLSDVLAGKSSLFTGHSGVGKSSLLNALEPGLTLRVGSVTSAAAGLGKGRHTTTSARFVPLSQPDTFVVDSPGIRGFAVHDIKRRELSAHFPDIARLGGSCPFRDCLHDGEEGCALPEAASTSAFLQARIESYRKLLSELS